MNIDEYECEWPACYEKGTVRSPDGDTMLCQEHAVKGGIVAVQADVDLGVPR